MRKATLAEELAVNDSLATPSPSIPVPATSMAKAGPGRFATKGAGA